MDKKELDEIVCYGKKKEQDRMEELEGDIKKAKTSLEKERQFAPRTLHGDVSIIPVRNTDKIIFSEYASLIEELNEGTPIIVFVKGYHFPLDLLLMNLGHSGCAMGPYYERKGKSYFELFEETFSESETKMLICSDKEWVEDYDSNVFVPKHALGMNFEKYREQILECSYLKDLYHLIGFDILEQDQEKFDEIFGKHLDAYRETPSHSFEIK